MGFQNHQHVAMPDGQVRAFAAYSQSFQPTTAAAVPSQSQPQPQRQTDRLPSLSVLMQPFAHTNSSSDSYSQMSRGQPLMPLSSLSSLHVPQHQQAAYYQHTHQHHSQTPYCARPLSPPDANHHHSWSPASATSSVDSAGDAPFPIRRQTFAMYDSPTDNQQQQQHQPRQSRQPLPPCSCGCDPVSPDEEAALLAAAQFRAPPARACATATRDNPKPVISPASESCTSNGTSNDTSNCTSRNPGAEIVKNNHEATSTSSGTVAGAAASGKTSRYLREMDRRAILARLDKGEKQSVLAKEYHVSRSSICNLFKHRDEVLSRVHQNPFTKHPKRPRANAAGTGACTAATGTTSNSGLAGKATEKLITCVKAIYSPFAPAPNSSNDCSLMTPAVHSLDTDMMVDTTGRVHRVRSRAAAVLLSILDKPALTAPEFRRCANQIMLVLVEETLVMLPALVAENCGTSRLSPNPLVAITLEQANQHAMLDVFHSVEPHCPRGYVQFERSHAHQDVKIQLLDAQLAAPLQSHNVLLLDVAVTSPPLLAVVVESLLRNGAIESQITVVAVFVSQQVVELVQRRFPAVRIIATDIESGGCALATSEHMGGGAPAPPRSVLFKHRLDHMYASRSMDMLMM